MASNPFYLARYPAMFRLEAQRLLALSLTGQVANHDVPQLIDVGEITVSDPESQHRPG